MASPAQASGPLNGLRVIDLTAMVMGPYCTQMMADMGAEVIKIEPPDGDNTRYISVGPTHGMSGVFVNVNRGKRSVVLDLRAQSGVAAMRVARLKQGPKLTIHTRGASGSRRAVWRCGWTWSPRVIHLAEQQAGLRERRHEIWHLL